MQDLVRQEIDRLVPVILIDHDLYVTACSDCAAHIMGLEEGSQAVGVSVKAVSEGMLVSHPEWVEQGLVNPDGYAENLITGILRPVADQVGFSCTWLWLVDAKSGHLRRVSMSVRRLDSGYLILGHLLEDPTNLSFRKLLNKGRYLVGHGTVSAEDVAVVDAFMSGLSYRLIANQFEGMTASQAKRRIVRISNQLGFEGAGDLREAIWAKHSEEFMISPQQTVIGALPETWRL